MWAYGFTTSNLISIHFTHVWYSCFLVWIFGRNPERDDRTPSSTPSFPRWELCTVLGGHKVGMDEIHTVDGKNPAPLMMPEMLFLYEFQNCFGPHKWCTIFSINRMDTSWLGNLMESFRMRTHPLPKNSLPIRNLLLIPFWGGGRKHAGWNIPLLWDLVFFKEKSRWNRSDFPKIRQ